MKLIDLYYPESQSTLTNFIQTLEEFNVHIWRSQNHLYKKINCIFTEGANNIFEMKLRQSKKMVFFRHSAAGFAEKLLQSSELENNIKAQRKITGPAFSMGKCNEF